MNPLRCDFGDGTLRPLGDAESVELPAGATFAVDLASGGHWFGHGFAHRQPWPLGIEPLANAHFAVNNCQSPIWASTAGVSILADTTQELDVRINEGSDGLLRVRCDAAPVTLRLFRGPDLPSAQAKLLAGLDWPNAAPPAGVLGDCIFCTWTQFPRCITQARVIETAEAIRRHDYPCSTITLDDRWESAYGELEFSADFPDPAAMVARLHELGFRVLLWVTPFVNEEARTFAKLSADGALVQRQDGGGAATFKWWGGTAGLVDLTAPAGRGWMGSQLRRLQSEIGVDGFKIDGGDAKYQPSRDIARWHADPGPSGYSDLLLELFEQIAPGACETRTMWLSQRRSILWRQGGKNSHWGVDNGLAAMVHIGLHMAVMGYDVQIPDMIPGRVQTMSPDDPLVSDELMVRWTEASAFFPIMQFSYFPWNYAAPTADAAAALARVHKSLENYLHRQAAGRSLPLIRPVGYANPADAALWTVGNQWLLGDDLLAAPVLVEGAARRNVTLPPGRWLDAWTGSTHDGPTVLADVPAPCPGIPLFVRAESSDLFETLHAALQSIARGSVPCGGVTTATWQSGIERDLNVTG